MPIYDFICKACGEHFDRLTPFDWKAAGVTCPKCQSAELDKAVPLVGAYHGGNGGSGHAHAHSHGGGGCSTCSSGVCSTCH